jgi:SAM-dependent methyltransferase
MPEQFDESFWDERYRTHPTAIWSGEPNAHLVGEAGGLSPGAAFDVGCGEGADAIWLAAGGWRVTAVDLSAVALQRAAAAADQAGGEVAARIEWVHADLTIWDPGEVRFDLVSAQFMHLRPLPRQSLVARLGGAVAPGGTLLLVAHHPSDQETTIPRPREPELFYTGDQIAESLDPAHWTVITNAAIGRNAIDPEGNSVTIHDTVFRARRRE